MDTRAALLQRTRARQDLPPPEQRRQIRLAAGASLADLAEALQVTPQAVWCWETGRTSPSADNVAGYVGLLADLAEATS